MSPLPMGPPVLLPPAGSPPEWGHVASSGSGKYKYKYKYKCVCVRVRVRVRVGVVRASVCVRVCACVCTCRPSPFLPPHQATFHITGEARPREFKSKNDEDLLDVVITIVGQLKNTLPLIPYQ